jgi:NAD(P)-dependent dehydrogenase (short-subunit alcohol dehydrogenase family)
MVSSIDLSTLCGSRRPLDQSLRVVITGVTRGLGRAMVDEFIGLGHHVIGCARTATQIEELNREYPTHDFQAVDVACASSVKGWADRVFETYGAPDFLLNNAAVLNSRAPLWEVSDQEFSSQIDINVKGVANVIRYFVPYMMARGLGVMVNFTSRWANESEKHMAPYCASKSAVAALTRVVAEELEPFGITALAFNPGVVQTQMLATYLGENTSGMCNHPTPVQWANVAVPLLLRLCMEDSGRLIDGVN